MIQLVCNDRKFKITKLDKERNYNNAKHHTQFAVHSAIEIEMKGSTNQLSNYSFEIWSNF